VDAFIEAIEESELKSHIKKVDVSVMAPPREFRGFEILK
jgi:cellobiose-specific phosphotransferase system component IIB